MAILTSSSDAMPAAGAVFPASVKGRVVLMYALLIGGIEALGLIGVQFKIHGAVWDIIGSLNNNFGLVGFAIIGVFVMCWTVSILIYRRNRYDEIQVNTSPAGGGPDSRIKRAAQSIIKNRHTI